MSCIKLQRKRIGKIQSDDSEESYQFHIYNLVDGEDRYKPACWEWTGMNGEDE